MSENNLIDELLSGLNELNLHLNPNQVKLLISYLNLLNKWNKSYNLTAVRDLNQMVGYHLLDSLSVIKYIQDEQLKHIADIGTGAGLPAYPLAIAMPEIQFSLVEINHKRISFLRQVAIELDIKNIKIYHERVENLNFGDDQKPDAVISRAFSDLKEFILLSKILLKPNGKFFAMKGLYPYEEVTNLPQYVQLKQIAELHVPNVEGSRHLVILEKIEEIN